MIVLDCGHSKTTSGKHSPDKSFFEYEYNRILGKRIGNRLTELGIDWCFTYSTDAENDLSLSQRANVANRWASELGKNNVILISLHFNAASMGEWVEAEGFCVFSTKGNTVSDKFANIVVEEAEKILKPLKKKIRGHLESNFTVIFKTTCPSILIEYGFYTDKSELEFMKSEEGLKAYEDITVNAILRFNENKTI